jgi:hypothetical protein
MRELTQNCEATKRADTSIYSSTPAVYLFSISKLGPVTIRQESRLSQSSCYTFQALASRDVEIKCSSGTQADATRQIYDRFERRRE